jgi:hypothetical protein
MTPHTASTTDGFDQAGPLSFDESTHLEPDPARSYERASPQKEYGDERLDCQPARRCCSPDQMIRAVHNAHRSNQLNSDSSMDAGASNAL